MGLCRQQGKFQLHSRPRRVNILILPRDCPPLLPFLLSFPLFSPSLSVFSLLRLFSALSLLYSISALVELFLMAKISKEELTRQLETTINQRARSYNRVIWFSFRFEDDYTRASDEYKNLNQILKIIGGEEAELFVLSKISRFPQWDLEAALRRHLTQLLTLDGR